MKLKANDTIHISELKSGNIVPDEEFEASESTGKELVERGLAVEVKATAKKSKGK